MDANPGPDGVKKDEQETDEVVIDESAAAVPDVVDPAEYRGDLPKVEVDESGRLAESATSAPETERLLAGDDITITEHVDKAIRFITATIEAAIVPRGRSLRPSSRIG